MAAGGAVAISVPNQVPWEKVSESIPSEMVMSGGLLKSIFDWIAG